MFICHHFSFGKASLRLSALLCGELCFDVAVCKANAGKARISKIGVVFHALHEKNILVEGQTDLQRKGKAGKGVTKLQAGAEAVQSHFRGKRTHSTVL